MVEVIVALVIIAISLMGTAALQLTAMRVNKGGQLRNQAVFLASDLVERMETNTAVAVTGGYVVAATGNPPALSKACDDGPCAPAALAAYDLSIWQNNVSKILPSSTWAVTQTIAGDPSTYTITISWRERLSNTTQQNAAAVDELFTYTATRTVID